MQFQIADFDPDSPQQPQETIPQPQINATQQVNPNVVYSDRLYDVDPQVKKMADDNLPQGCTKIFRIEWWQSFFQCNTKEIFSRVLQSLIIFKGNFMQQIQDSQKTDLWYPVWLTITLIFLSFLCSIATNLTVDNPDYETSSAEVGVIAAVIVLYTFLVPLIYTAVAWCLDMQGIHYLTFVDFTSYCQTILLPALAFYFVVQVIVANDILRSIDIALFSLCAVWSELFILIQGIKYIKTFQGTKGQILGITITYLICLGCLMFIVNKN